MSEYLDADRILEEYRLLRIEEGLHNNTFFGKMFGRKTKWRDKHKAQWKITETLYHFTDEYKKTRGY